MAPTVNHWKRNFQIYRMRQNGASFKSINEALEGSDYTSIRNVYDRMDQMVTDFGVNVDDAEEMAKIVDKFVDGRDVMRVVYLLTNKAGVKNIHEIANWDLGTKKLNGFGPKYRQVLENIQTYLRHGMVYKRDVHLTLSAYAYDLMKKQAAADGSTLSAVVDNALLFYCDCGEACQIKLDKV